MVERDFYERDEDIKSEPPKKHKKCDKCKAEPIVEAHLWQRDGSCVSKQLCYVHWAIEKKNLLANGVKGQRVGWYPF